MGNVLGPVFAGVWSVFFGISSIFWLTAILFLLVSVLLFVHAKDVYSACAEDAS